jgi:TolA-binding protein
MTASDRPCPDDLLARARSHGLSDLERRALTAHLAGCGACATSAVVATLFRESAEDQPGDPMMVARVARRVGAKHAAGNDVPRWRGRAFALATLTLLLIGSGALAWVGRKGGALSSIFHRSTNAPPRMSSDLAPREPLPSVEARPAPEAWNTVAEPTIPHAKRRPATAKVASASVMDQVLAPSAAAMFADANATRRRGDLRGAVSIYQTLRRQFPETSEARLSAISLGDVLLDLRSPGRALDTYDAYLAENVSGSLREEALFGRTRCLRSLDRRPTELDTWQTLLREFPRSAYASLARRRLAELQR